MKTSLIKTLYISILFTLFFSFQAFAADGVSYDTSTLRTSVDEWAESTYGSGSDEYELISNISDEISRREYYMDGKESSSRTDGRVNHQPTIANAKDVIEEATAKGFGYDTVAEAKKSDTNAKMFMQSWYAVYKAQAENYGISAGSTTDTLNTVLNTLGINAGLDDAGRLEDTSQKINILTWDRSTSASGGNISDVSTGKISGLLSRFDTAFSTFMAAIAAISVSLTLAFGCSSLIQMSSDRMLSSDALLREFIKILFGIWLVLNYRYFALLIIRLGTLITETILNVDVTSGADSVAYPLVYSSLLDLLKENPDPYSLTVTYSVGTWSTVLSIAGNVLDPATKVINVIGGNTICRFVTSLTIYAIAIEIGIRYLFTPIAIADLYSERFKSSGFMWLKKLLAVSLQGAIIYLIMYGCMVLKDLIGGIGIARTIVNIVMLGMFASSRTIACEIVGVR